MERPLDVNMLRGLRTPPLDFVVTKKELEIPELKPVYRTGSFNVYRISE
jgi:hypothetical protein